MIRRRDIFSVKEDAICFSVRLWMLLQRRVYGPEKNRNARKGNRSRKKRIRQRDIEQNVTKDISVRNHKDSLFCMVFKNKEELLVYITQ